MPEPREEGSLRGVDLGEPWYSSRKKRTHRLGKIGIATLDTDRGIWAIQFSLLILLITAALQGIVVVYSGSVALLADTIHNVADAFTALPLWIAFALSRRRATRRFTYGYDRAEDIAGVLIMLVILASAIIAGYESYLKLAQAEVPRHLGWAMGAALVGFLGNEAVAHYRIKVGREIGSAALVADGQHARVDGLTSLAALAGLFGVFWGYPLADPLAGLLITAAIFLIAYETGGEILSHLMDAIDPETVEEIERTAMRIPGIRCVHDIRARWLGHQIHVEIHINVDGHLSVIEGHRIAEEARHTLIHRITRLSEVIIHVDPVEEAGGSYHDLTAHHFKGDQPPENR